MSSRAEKIGICALLAAVGCAAKPLQEPDGGGTGTIGRDGGATGIAGATGSGAATGTAGATGTGGATGSGGTLFTGRRSFVVMSAVAPLGSGEGGGVRAHTFTMVVDGERFAAISGADGSATVSAVQPTAGGFRIVGSLVFTDAADPICGGSLTYENLAFTFDPSGGLRGSASGQRVTIVGDVASTAAVTMSMTAVADTVAPLLALISSTDITDPFSSFSLVPSEPLLTQSQPVLRAASGDAVTLSPYATSGGEAMIEFLKPAVILRFGELYHVDLGAGVADFAGNAASGAGLTFTTRAAPPLIAADGFESVTGATLGGAQVLSGAGDPVINGTRSLYIPPGAALATPSAGVALRLPVAPGSTVLRFAYRYVNPGAVIGSYFVVGSVGGTIATVVPSLGGAGLTPAMIAGSQVMVGPIASATVELPVDAAHEIVIERATSGSDTCGLGFPQTAGIIIDDMRTE